jgi:hypothetical protein
VVFEGHKLIWHEGSGRFELYDLQKDPLEQQNLAGQLPEVALRLRRTIGEWASELQPAIAERTTLSDAEIQRLQNLGYLVEGDDPEDGTEAEEPFDSEE